jgi:hypothetical protein
VGEFWLAHKKDFGCKITGLTMGQTEIIVGRQNYGN